MALERGHSTSPPIAGARYWDTADHGRQGHYNGNSQEDLGMSSGSPEHHVDRLGYRLGDRPGNPVVAAEERIGYLRWPEQPLLTILSTKLL